MSNINSDLAESYAVLEAAGYRQPKAEAKEKKATVKKATTKKK